MDEQVDEDDEFLRKRLRKSVLVLAWTNRAAAAIGGATFSSGFLNTFEAKETREAKCSPYVEMVIFEEFSMMSLRNVQDLHLNKVKPVRPAGRSSFGGVTMVFIGDIFQLEPVNGRRIVHTLEILKRKTACPAKEIPDSNGALLWHCVQEAGRDLYVVRVNQQFRLNGPLKDAVEEMRSAEGLSEASAQLMVDLTSSGAQRRRIHLPEHACHVSGCEGCIALFAINSVRVQVGVSLNAVQGSLLCQDGMVYCCSQGASSATQDNKQVLYPGMMIRSNHNEKDTFLLNGLNCVLVAIFPDKDEDSSVMTSIQGVRIRELTKCPEFIAVCEPNKWREVARRLQQNNQSLDDYASAMVELIRENLVLLIKRVAADTDKGGDAAQSNVKLPKQCIPVSPANVGTMHKLQGATVRGRVVIDLNGIKSTQAIYTAITRSTTADLLTITPQTDMAQWKNVRFPKEVYAEHQFLTKQAVWTMEHFPEMAKDMLGADADGVFGTVGNNYKELLSKMSVPQLDYAMLMNGGGGGVVRQFKLINAPLLKDQTKCNVLVTKTNFTFENLLDSFNHPGLEERFKVTRESWFAQLDGVRDLEVRWRL